MLVPMNSTATTTPPRLHPLALPNILTYGRIAAVPIVVGCMFYQNILHGPLWLRWAALAVFIAAGISDAILKPIVRRLASFGLKPSREN